MTEFGGMGGLLDGREFNSADLFEQSVERVLGERIRADENVARDMWSALANVDWYHPKNNHSASYSFRAAGDLVAAIRGSGNYMDWYCSGPDGQVARYIAMAMKKEGWIYDDIPSICDEPGCFEGVSCGTPTPEGYRSTCGKHKPIFQK